MTLVQEPPPVSTVVHFKVSAQGITLTTTRGSERAAAGLPGWAGKASLASPGVRPPHCSAQAPGHVVVTHRQSLRSGAKAMIQSVCALS